MTRIEYNIEENSTWYNIDGNANRYMILMNMSERCNLDCIYCYEHNKQGRDVNLRKALSKLDKILLRLGNTTDLIIQFSGGEPLLVFESIKEIYTHVSHHYIDNGDWQGDIKFGVSTNGALLTTNMKKWFKQHPRFSLALSFDGTPEAHNKNRCGSYDAIAKNFDFFRRYKIPVKMTIGPQSISDCAAGIKHIHSLGFESTANLVFEDVWGDQEARRRYLQVFAEQLSELVAFYAENFALPRSTLIMPLIGNLSTNQNHPYERNCGLGKTITVIDIDGEEYPCHRFTPMSNNRPLKKIDFGTVSVKPLKCATCPVLAMCPGCGGYNYEYYGDINKKTIFHCEFFLLQVRSAAILTFRDIERIKTNVGLDHLSENQKIIINQRLHSALFAEEYTRPLYLSLMHT
ncbi:MAG: radical SAM protein [Methanosarcinaceae archaeon]|nr:radical SAM protein [Methanosarcinaceae archaeon]